MVFNMESVQFLGLAVCLDTLLYMFTVLPLRFCIALYRLLFEVVVHIYSTVKGFFVGFVSCPRRRALSDDGHDTPSEDDFDFQLDPSAITKPSPTRSCCGKGSIGARHGLFHRMHAYDIARGIILIVSPVALSLLAGDISWLYHVIRTQEFMKLYVIINMLDIFDRLVTVFGQESFEQLYRTICYYDNKRTLQLLLALVKAGTAAMCYVILHSLVSFVQIITLNVAMSSKYSSVLLLLISSNFVEIKGLVFKRFDESNLFQITCADITERFFLYLSLFCVFVQNTDFTRGDTWSLPSMSYFASLEWVSWEAWVEHVAGSPTYAIILGEMAVDLIKHSFILKFNNIPATVYQKFAAIIAEDATMYRLGSSREGATQQAASAESKVDPTHAVTQRLALPSFALATVIIRVGMRVYRQVDDAGLLSHGTALLAMVLLVFACLCCFKLLVSMAVAHLARRVKQTLVDRYSAEKQEQLAHADFYGQQEKHRRRQKGGTNHGAPRQSTSSHSSAPAGTAASSALHTPNAPPPRSKRPSGNSPEDLIRTPSESLDKLRNIKRFEMHGKRVV